MLKTTRNRIMPTAIAGSHPRPLWFDASLQGRSFKGRWATRCFMSNIWMGRRDLSIFCT
jgi:hypothetical protein